ncbi:MAG: GAF domain-containing protein [Gemmatimonadetes bacterium]|nr:MAG: GAF domain-containing protein [Gemmatimonadota bacterium]
MDRLFDHRYILDQRLGEGSSGTVFAAWDTQAERHVALKQLAQRQFSERFRREFSILTRLDHPNILKVHDFGMTDEGIAYFTMELLPEGALTPAAFVGQEASVRNLGDQVCQGLAVVHLRRIVHGDIKPENILMSRERIFKLMDFGLSTDFEVLRTSGLAGTLAYMSPERIRGVRNDPRSDLYALGVMLYQLISGEFPFSIATISDCIQGHLYQSPQPLTDFPDLWRIIERLLQKNPAERYQTAEDVRAVLYHTESGMTAPVFCKTGDFVNRSAEQDRLIQFARDQRAGVLSIGGKKGIGKSRLLREIKFRLQLEGFPVFVVSPKSGGITLQPLVQAVLQHYPAEDVAPQLVKILPTHPDFAGIAPAETPEDLFYDQVAAYLAHALSELQMIVLADDRDRWDTLSMAIFDQLCEQTQTPIFYTEENHTAADIRLRPLARTDLQDLIYFVLGRIDDPNRLLESVLVQSQGNPGQAEEWIHTLIDQRLLVYRQGQWHVHHAELAQFEGSLDVEALFITRLEQRPADDRQVLNWLAVAHQPVSAQVIADVTGRPLPAIYGILTDLLRDNWVTESEFGYQLARIEYQQALYHHLADVATWHARLAAVLEALNGDSWEDLAFHFEAAQHYEKAYEYVTKLSKQATRQGLYSLAIQYNQKGLALVQHLEDRQQDAFYLQLEIARLYRLAAKFDEAIDIYRQVHEQAKQMNELKLVADSISDMGTVYLDQGDWQTARRYFEEALSYHQQSDNPVGMAVALGNIGATYFNSYQYDPAIESFEQALVYARQSGKERLIALNALNLGSVYYSKGQFAAAVAQYRITRDIAEQKKQHIWILLASSNISWVGVARGEVTEAQQVIAYAAEQFQTAKKIKNWIDSILRLGKIAYFQGQYDVARSYFEQVIIATEAVVVPRIDAFFWLGLVHFECHDVEPFITCLREALALATDHQQTKEEMLIRLWLSPSAARLDEITIPDPELHILGGLRVMQYHLVQGSAEHLTGVLERLQAHLQDFPHVYWVAEVDRLTGLLAWQQGEYEQAQHYLTKAIRQFDHLKNRTKAHQTRYYLNSTRPTDVPVGLLDQIAALNQARDLPTLIDRTVDAVISLSGAERGFIMLADEQGTLRFQTARGLNREALDGDEFAISRTIVRQAYETAQPVVVDDTSTQTLPVTRSIVDLELRMIICLPLLKFSPPSVTPTDPPLGVLYVDATVENPHFSKDQLLVLTALAQQAAIAIENVRLTEKLVSKIDLLSEQLSERFQFGQIIGKSRPMQQLYRQLEVISEQNVTVLITGETGTGKELVARAIHYNSPRKAAPFVAINCAALPENLLESELFGHEKGAFTGAIQSKPGKFEVANGGTLFLDEIGDMPLSTQAKVLRVIQDRTFQRIGSNRDISVDIRLIAATHRDLIDLIEKNEFREDLYYRIAVVPIQLPPLRERREDIPLLVRHFIQKLNPKLGKTITKITDTALTRLMQQDWRGNIRQLENIIERMMIFASDSVLSEADLPADLLAPTAQLPAAEVIPQTLDQLKQAKADRIAALEKQFITYLLTQFGGNIRQATKAAGINRTQFYAMMSKYGINWQDYRR